MNVYIVNIKTFSKITLKMQKNYFLKEQLTRDGLLRVFLRDTVAPVRARSKSGFCHSLTG